MPSVPDDGADHPKPKQAHARPLHEGRGGAVVQGHADHQQTDAIIRRIAEEIEGIRLKRCRSCRKAGTDLDDKHDGIDAKHSPKDTAISGSFLGLTEIGWWSGTTIGHALKLGHPRTLYNHSYWVSRISNRPTCRCPAAPRRAQRRDAHDGPHVTVESATPDGPVTWIPPGGRPASSTTSIRARFRTATATASLTSPAFSGACRTWSCLAS